MGQVNEEGSNSRSQRTASPPLLQRVQPEMSENKHRRRRGRLATATGLMLIFGFQPASTGDVATSTAPEE